MQEGCLQFATYSNKAEKEFEVITDFTKKFGWGSLDGLFIYLKVANAVGEILHHYVMVIQKHRVSLENLLALRFYNQACTH